MRRDRPATRRTDRQLTAVVAAVIASIGAGCQSRDSHKVAVPSSPALTAPTGTRSIAPTASASIARNAVIRAYTGYWQASRVAATKTVTEARRLLEQYSTSSNITIQLRGIDNLRKQHKEPWGNVAIHVYKVEAAGSSARLWECQDASGAGLADARTHRLIPTTTGSPHIRIQARLVRGSDGAWRVSVVRFLDNSCT